MEVDLRRRYVSAVAVVPAQDFDVRDDWIAVWELLDLTLEEPEHFFAALVDETETSNRGVQAEVTLVESDS
ncbi:hypothetical protein MAE02_34940 [Microvirga aerophila]|uniref:Uncharacterized protein n=1 Tax=Microvirga aerophila TaxID=670291 RepID=A0A512BV09_9HYPH|nr:hypothetical protein MAE02_34940 [Microvirga aerophila]